jgi:hypothetical protein
MLGNKDSPGLANRIIDELFALYDPRTCTVAVAIQELYNVSSSMHLQKRVVVHSCQYTLVLLFGDCHGLPAMCAAKGTLQSFTLAFPPQQAAVPEVPLCMLAGKLYGPGGSTARPDGCADSCADRPGNTQKVWQAKHSGQQQQRQQ